MSHPVLTIKGELTDLNSYIRVERGNKYAAAGVKQAETSRVYIECKVQKIPKQKKGVFIIFQWYAKDQKKDKDNVAFAKKFILDGLVLAGVLESDRWDFISGFLDVFYVDSENPRVEITFCQDPDEIKVNKLIKVN